ncbi:MAG: S49 family peptidase [Alphaproteobacteria bacterium]|nr:S49 family peptidase [Alphaproteobacteria bacterium]
MWKQLADRFRRAPVVPVVRLSGVIAPGGRLGRGGLSIETVAPLLKRAFDTRRARAVAFAVNSPGGSPVQSSLIGQRIRALSAEKGLPTIAFVEDVAASGGYWLACAADEIVADPSSVVGSIGVVSAGFGFAGLLDRIGVERRVHTSGDRKAMLDPFRPERADEVERLKALQVEIHDDFKAWVRARRDGRLKGDEATLYSGEFWTGRRGLELGLVDSLGELRGTLRARYGEDVRLPVIGPRRGLLARAGLGARLEELAPGALDAMEERALWARYGR